MGVIFAFVWVFVGILGCRGRGVGLGEVCFCLIEVCRWVVVVGGCMVFRVVEFGF